MKKTIFFDCFGVIVSEVAVAYFKKYFDEKTYMKLKDEIFTRVDIGELSEMDGYNCIAKLRNVSLEEVKKEWYDNIRINFDLVNFIKELSKNYDVYLLSNAASSFVRNIFNQYNLNDLFKKMYISSEIKKIKPNKDYFEYVLYELNLKSSDCIMIDDSVKNIQTCLDINLNGIVFKDNEQLKNDLKKYDVNVK